MRRMFFSIIAVVSLLMAVNRANAHGWTNDPGYDLKIVYCYYYSGGWIHDTRFENKVYIWTSSHLWQSPIDPDLCCASSEPFTLWGIYSDPEMYYNAIGGGVPNDPGYVSTWGYTPYGGTGGASVYFKRVKIEDDSDYNEHSKSNNLDKTKDPVNIINGYMTLDKTDIAIPCPEIGIDFSRYYNSGIDYTNGAMGARWTHSYDWRLAETTTVSTIGDVTNVVTHQLKIIAGDGSDYYLTISDTNNWNRWQGHRDSKWSAVKTNNQYRVNLGGGVEYVFDTNGVLNSITGVWHNVITLTYTNSYPSNLLTRVEHSNGKYLNLSYNSSNRISAISTPSTNLNMSFNYNAQGELVSAARVTSTGTNSSSYLYDYTTNICNHSMTQMINAVGTVYKYQYLTNSSGYITSKCTNTVISTNYYLTYLNFYTNENRTCLTYSSGSTNQVYDYYYDPDTLRYSSIIGPGSSNTYTTFSYDELYQSCTNKQVNEGSEYLRTVTAYGDGFVTNEASGYCSAPSNYWKYTWNTNLQVITSITDPESHKTEYEYTNAFISKVKLFYDASNAYETAYAYTTNGLLSVVTNANGHSVGYYYDSYGYMASAVPQDGPTISYAHNSLGILTNISLPSSDMDSNEVPILRNTSFDVNELGWVKKITYADGGYESFSFDSLGNITNKVDTGGRNTKYTYLPTKKLSSITKSLGTTNITTSFTYDNQFNTLTITDAKSRAVESYLLDIQDRPVTVTNLEGQTMSITYGLGSYVKQINRFDGTTVSNSYNSDGLLSSIKYPDATNNLLYYKNSMLKSVSSGSGIISNTYNTANRLSSVQVSGFIPQPYTVSYSYFPAGQLSNVVSTAGTNSYTLDNADRISTFNANIPGLSSALAFNWSYNTNNGLASGITSTNSGISVAYDYDYRDRVTSIIWRNASNEVLKSFGYSYNSTGMISDISYETGESVHYTYDGLDRLTGETHYSPASGIISDDGYGYDEVGNRTSKTRSGLTLSYSYPYGTNGNRLSSWSVTSTNQTAFVDIMGSANETIGTNPHFGQLWVSNETSVTPFIDGTNFWVYELPVNLGTQQVVAAIRDVAGNTTFVTNTVFLSIVTNGLYGYNSAGCITNISYSGSNYSQNISLLWNAQYQLTQISTNGDVAERNGYDALGRRAWNWDGVSTNYFVYNGQQIIADVDSAGTIKRSYIWGPGIDNLLVMNVHTGATVVTYYALKDHLGSIHAMADEAGQIVESYRYDSWGRTTAYDANGVALTESQIGNRYCWQGREYSWITGLYYFRARWYDPITGRWLSNDPIGISGGLNQYVFCGNNPVNYRDPMGLADRAITQQEFDNAMASAYDDVINGTAPKLWQEYIPLVGVLIRLAHLDMPEFRDPEGAEKDVFYLEGGDDNCSTKTKNKRLGLGEEVNYAKIGMWDNKYNPVPGSSMWVWKLLRWGQLPSSQTKEWYEIGYQYANDRGSPNIPKNGSLLNPVYIH